MAERVYSFDKSEGSKLKEVLDRDPYASASFDAKKVEEEKKKDPYFDLLFVRQDNRLIDGAAYGLDENKYYLYINASEDFLSRAEQMFKERFKTFKRLEPEEEGRLIKRLNEEKDNALSGFGAIFGS
ncbi:MAG: hypothetical protein ARM1_0111 [Candidatus Micrarchaeota archaeon]|nr:MAG: hypothetical protein ARM1_0111 [Candidatus Micrarchaeota archaeon]